MVFVKVQPYTIKIIVTILLAVNFFISSCNSLSKSYDMVGEYKGVEEDNKQGIVFMAKYHSLLSEIQMFYDCTYQQKLVFEEAINKVIVNNYDKDSVVGMNALLIQSNNIKKLFNRNLDSIDSIYELTIYLCNGKITVDDYMSKILDIRCNTIALQESKLIDFLEGKPGVSITLPFDIDLFNYLMLDSEHYEYKEINSYLQDIFNANYEYITSIIKIIYNIANKAEFSEATINKLKQSIGLHGALNNFDTNLGTSDDVTIYSIFNTDEFKNKLKECVRKTNSYNLKNKTRSKPPILKTLREAYKDIKAKGIKLDYEAALYIDNLMPLETPSCLINYEELEIIEIKDEDIFSKNIDTIYELSLNYRSDSEMKEDITILNANNENKKELEEEKDFKDSFNSNDAVSIKPIKTNLKTNYNNYLYKIFYYPKVKGLSNKNKRILGSLFDKRVKAVSYDDFKVLWEALEGKIIANKGGSHRCLKNNVGITLGSVVTPHSYNGCEINRFIIERYLLRPVIRLIEQV